MTLHEIEETLHELQSRHSGLNETLLVTLLRSGGWEENNIKEAIHLFRSGSTEEGKTAQETAPVPGFLPSLQTETVLMPQIDEKHFLMEHNSDVIPHEKGERSPEPQSLIEEIPAVISRAKEELPHNLPLRPFETSEHIWPFARYKDVFYGDIEPVEPVKEVEEKINVSEPQIIVPPVTAQVEEVKVGVIIPEEGKIPAAEVLKERPIEPVPAAKGGEKLAIIACVMLLAILLLLGYMYSNGRL